MQTLEEVDRDMNPLLQSFRVHVLPRPVLVHKILLPFRAAAPHVSYGPIERVAPALTE